MNSKTVLVTGSSRGIGKAIALRFAREGFNVIINCSKQEQELLHVKEEIERYPVSCLTYVGNVGDYGTAEDLVAKARAQFGTIDVLVNNAGISHIGLFTDMDIAKWNEIINTNLTSAFNCSRLVVPDMIARKAGKIINISSVWGSAGASCEVAYSASKGGLDALTRALAKELAPSNIQVNAVACGAIDTRMNHFLSEEEVAALIEDIPANRLGKTEEVAAFVYQLATGNDYINGQIITMDGAWI